MKSLHEYQQAIRCAHEMLSLGDDINHDKLACIFQSNYVPLDAEELLALRQMISDWATVVSIEGALTGQRPQRNPFMLADFVLRFADALAKLRAAREPLDRFLERRH